MLTHSISDPRSPVARSVTMHSWWWSQKASKHCSRFGCSSDASSLRPSGRGSSLRQHQQAELFELSTQHLTRTPRYQLLLLLLFRSTGTCCTPPRPALPRPTSPTA